MPRKNNQTDEGKKFSYRPETDIEKIRKTQTERMLEIEKLSKCSATTDRSLNNKMQETEDRISGAEDKLEETFIDQ